MAALTLLAGTSDPEAEISFLEKLQRSRMIEINYRHSYENNPPIATTTRIPEALGCAFSARLRNLCASENSLSFSAEELLGESFPSFAQRHHQNTNIHDYLGYFVKWLYTSQIDPAPVYYGNIWFFGQQIGAPKFQNALLQEACRNLNSKRWFSASDNLMTKSCWDIAHFSQDGKQDHRAYYDESYWEDKKILKFMLDCVVYHRNEKDNRKDHLMELIRRGGDLAVAVAGLLAVAEKTGSQSLRPWEGEKVNQYLVDDNIPEVQTVEKISPGALKRTVESVDRADSKKSRSSKDALGTSDAKPTSAQRSGNKTTQAVKKEGTPEDQDITDDAEEDDTKYCTCQRVSFGKMVACDNNDCPYEWFHWSCVGLKQEPKGLWLCTDCTKMEGDFLAK